MTSLRSVDRIDPCEQMKNENESSMLLVIFISHEKENFVLDLLMAAYYTYNFLPPVSSDFDSLLHDFEQQVSHDYQSFANVWRNHRLELLFKYSENSL